MNSYLIYVTASGTHNWVMVAEHADVEVAYSEAHRIYTESGELDVRLYDANESEPSVEFKHTR